MNKFRPISHRRKKEKSVLFQAEICLCAKTFINAFDRLLQFRIMRVLHSFILHVHSTAVKPREEMITLNERRKKSHHYYAFDYAILQPNVTVFLFKHHLRFQTKDKM